MNKVSIRITYWLWKISLKVQHQFSGSGALNHSATAAHERRWLPPKHVKIFLSLKFLVIAKETSALAWGFKKLIFGRPSQRMKPDTLWSYLAWNKKYYKRFCCNRKKINMLDSTKCWFDVSDDHPDHWTQVIGFSIGALNHSAAAARVLVWIKSLNKLRCHKFRVHVPQSTWRTASKIAVTQVHA